MALPADNSMKFRNKLDSIDEGEGDGKKKQNMKNMEDELFQEDNPNRLVYKKMEQMLEQLQDPNSGITVRTVKNFISKIPSVFTGNDLISWIAKNLDVDDVAEAIHLANLLGAHGYIFPIDDHILSVKNDGTYYRFQTPCFWPSKCTEPENTDYAVYLCKRTMQNKQRLELVDYEAEHLARLQKIFSKKWEFIFIQAEAQAKVDKKRDKLERKVLDSQERAFWDVHRPAPGCINATEVDVKKTCRNIRNLRNNQLLADKGCLQSLSSSSSATQPIECDYVSVIDLLKAECTKQAPMTPKIAKLKGSIERRKTKLSKVVESYVGYLNQCKELDSFIHPSEPSNPWISDSTELWEQENNSKDVPSRRVKRWGFRFRELLGDAVGREHFRKFLEKEFSAENLKFWEACQKLKGVSERAVKVMVYEIYNEYLSPTALDPVNVDCRVTELVRKRVTGGQPDRYCFEEAESHIHQLMKNDCYNRYLRSDMFKEYLAGNKKKSKRGFATEVKRLRELTKTQGFVNLMQQQQQQQQQQNPSTRTTMQQVVHALRASHLSKQMLEQKQQPQQQQPQQQQQQKQQPQQPQQQQQLHSQEQLQKKSFEDPTTTANITTSPSSPVSTTVCSNTATATTTTITATTTAATTTATTTTAATTTATTTCNTPLKNTHHDFNTLTRDVNAGADG